MDEPDIPRMNFSLVQRVRLAILCCLIFKFFINLILPFSSLAVVMAEWTKLITCLVLVFYEEGKNIQQFVKSLRKTIIENPVDTIKVCVPSLLYVIQNNLLYLSASHLDAATYQVSVHIIT